MPEPCQVVTTVRRQRADAADLDADRAEVRKAAQRVGGDGERPRIEHVLERPELRVGDELVQHHARAEQVADRERVLPRHTHAPGQRREDPAEDLLHAEPDQPEHGVDEGDEREKRDQHRADVQRQRQPFGGAAARRVDDVDVGALDLERHRAHGLRRAGLGHEDLGHHQRAGRGHDHRRQQVAAPRCRTGCRRP